MLIESLIKRAEGTYVTLGKDIYHFFNHIEGDTRHVAEVTDEEHIQSFLSIKEGYRIAKKIKKPAPAAQTGAQGDKADADKAAADKAAADAAAKKAAEEKAAEEKAAADKAAADKAAADKAAADKANKA